MNISFLRDSPLNTTIINSTTGQLLYEVRTPWRITSRTTYVRRLSLGSISGRGIPVAKVHWHRLRSSKITVLGSTMRVKEFLPRDGFWSKSRTVIGIEGKQFRWKLGSKKFTLTDTLTGAVVAEAHRKRYAFFGSSRNMNINIYSHGFYNLDIVVVSFIILEEKRRRRQRGGNVATTYP
ncbi:hypothetical protein K439DRAFT_1331012 [Ramaria rubella]|nr:hypothetical protein K439DRAFT_1331012 [Ramaria rubella]